MYRAIGWIGLGVLCAAGCGTESPAAKPAPLLTRLDSEPPGAHCPDGGKVYRAGRDGNGDGVLGDAEVEHTEYVCDVAPPVLVRNDPLAPSLECPAGGVAVQTGLDDNHDGVLQDGEIDETARLCSSLELWNGNFTDGDWSDPIKVAAIKGARVVAGSLTVRADLPMLELVTGDLTAHGNFALPALRRVAGSLDVAEALTAPPTLPQLVEVDGNVFAASGLTRLALSSLQKIGGSLVANPGLEAVALPALATLRGDLRIGEFAERLEVPELRSVGGALVIAPGIVADSAVSLPVQTVGGALQLEGGLGGLTMNELVSIGGGIVLDSGPGASFTLALPSLETITGDVTASELETGLRLIELPKLTRLDGDLHLESAVELTRIALPAATEITGEIAITQASKLTAIELGALTRSGPIQIQLASRLATLSAPVLASVRQPRTLAAGIRLQLVALETVELPALRSVEGGVRFESNAALRTVRLPVLESTAQLFVSSCNLDSLSAPRLVSGGIVQLIGAQVHALDLAGLSTAQSIDFLDSTVDDLAGLRSLRDVNLLALNNVGGVKNLTDLESLRTVRSLGLHNNTELTSLDGLDQLTDLPGRLDVVGNAALDSIAGLRNVRHVGDDVVLSGSPALAGIALSSLQRIDGDLTIADLDAVTDLAGLDQLTTVSGNIAIRDNAQLPEAVIQAFLARLGH